METDEPLLQIRRLKLSLQYYIKINANPDNPAHSQRELEKNLKQIIYQNIFVSRSCIRSGLATQNLFTLDIHRRIFRRVKCQMADISQEIT